MPQLLLLTQAAAQQLLDREFPSPFTALLAALFRALLPLLSDSHTQSTQPTQPTQPTQQAQPEKTALVKENETDKCVQVQINGVRYRIRARRNLTTWNVVLHIEAREGEVQSFMYASEADVLFDVEYRGHVFKTPVNPRGTMKDLKVNAVTVGLAGAGDA